MIRELTALHRDAIFGHPVLVEQVPADVRSGQIQRISHVAPPRVGSPQPRLHEQRQDEADADDYVEQIDHINTNLAS